MYQYEVGKLYNPSRTTWQPGVQFSIRQGQPELLLIFDRPSFDEILAVRKSPSEFGICEIGNVIFFFYKFGSEIAWSDQPFSIHLVPENERELPALETENSRLTLQVILIEAKSGIIKVLRLVTFSPEFSRELLKLLTAQIAVPFDSPNYDRQINAVYAKYPSTRDLMLDVWTMTSGGE